MFNNIASKNYAICELILTNMVQPDATDDNLTGW